MAKKENSEMPEINRKLSQSIEEKDLMANPLLETAKKQSLLSKYNFGFNKKKLLSSFHGKFSLSTLSNTWRVKS